MSPIQKSMTPAPAMSAAPSGAGAKKPNLWMVVSIVLAIVLVGVVFTNYFSTKEEMTVLEPDVAGQTLLDFINEVYGAQIGTAVLKEVTPESGLYKVVISLVDPQTSQPVDQTVFLSRDGKYFVPQIVEIGAVLSQFRTIQQQPQAPVGDLPTDTVPADDANTNAAPEAGDDAAADAE